MDAHFCTSMSSDSHNVLLGTLPYCNLITMNGNTYKPDKTTMKIHAEMQRIAKCRGKSLKDTATELGFDCPYSWQQALKKSVFAKLQEESDRYMESSRGI